MTLTVYQVSNAGLLFQFPRGGLAVDCISRDPQKLYPDTSPGMRQFLMKEIREKRLNVLIFTHEHGDHFYLPDVLEAWKENPELLIISNQAVGSALRISGIPGENLIIVGGSAEGEISWIELDSVRVGLLVTKHEGKQYDSVKNLTVLLEVQHDKETGYRMVVTGDAMPCESFFRRIQSWSAKIDRMFLPFSYVGLPSVRMRMKQYLNTGSVYVVHQPRPEADTGKWMERAREICQKGKEDFPEVHWLT